MAEFHIGTSGWSYAGWRGLLYPPGLKRRELLSHYAKRFHSVEISDSFQRLPSEAMLRAWRNQVPPHFVFTLLAGKNITHGKRLQNAGEEWAALLERARLLGGRLGPIVLQFPSSFQRDIASIERFVASAPGASEHDLAFEFRHSSWFDPLALDELRQLRVGVVIAQSERYPQAPRVPTTGFAYLRFHGPGQLFASSYAVEELRPWAEKIRKWIGQGRRVYAYFTNDFEGHAFANARTLRQLVEGKPVSRSLEAAHH